MALIATDGDTESQECAHVPCVGGGTYSIPSTLQSVAYISGKAVIVNSQEFPAHGTATTVPSSSLLYVNGMAVVRHGDTVDHHHDNGGVEVSNQSFVHSG